MNERKAQVGPNMPRTLALLVLYTIATGVFDFSVLLSLYGPEVALVRHAAGTVDFMAQIIPAIEHMRDYVIDQNHNHTTDFFRSRGLPSPIIDYQTLISLNWILLILFLPPLTASLANEVRKSQKRLIPWAESWRPPLRYWGASAFDSVADKASSGLLGKTKIYLGCLFACFLIGIYSGYPFTAYQAMVMPAYFLLFVWCLYLTLIAIWIAFVVSWLISFYASRAG